MSRIKVYDLELFPVKLFVANGVSCATMVKRFHFCFPEKKWRSVSCSSKVYSELRSGCDAFTVFVIDRKDLCYGVLVDFCLNGEPDVDFMSVLSHEASHFADLVCDRVSVPYGSFRDGETHAYLCGWFFKTVYNSIKDKKGKK